MLKESYWLWDKPLSFGVLILTIDVPLLATSILGPKRLEFGTTGFAIANGIHGLVFVINNATNNDDAAYCFVFINLSYTYYFLYVTLNLYIFLFMVLIYSYLLNRNS